jgi:hypothetical protein
MASPARIARLAGSLYAINVVTGLFSLMYVPSRLIVHGDAAATYGRLVASEALFRAGIAVNVISHVVFLLLPLVLYALLSTVNKKAAVVMVALAVACVPIDLLAIANQLDVLSLMHDAATGRSFAQEQIQSNLGLLLHAYGNRLLLGEVFWGLWLLPFGYLVFKSGFLPRVLGFLLMLGCFSYLIDFFARLLAPELTVPGYVTLPAALGEIGIALWMLVMGTHRFGSKRMQGIAARD